MCCVVDFMDCERDLSMKMVDFRRHAAETGGKSWNHRREEAQFEEKGSRASHWPQNRIPRFSFAIGLGP